MSLKTYKEATGDNVIKLLSSVKKASQENIVLLVYLSNKKKLQKTERLIIIQIIFFLI